MGFNRERGGDDNGPPRFRREGGAVFERRGRGERGGGFRGRGERGDRGNFERREGGGFDRRGRGDRGGGFDRSEGGPPKFSRGGDRSRGSRGGADRDNAPRNDANDS